MLVALLVGFALTAVATALRKPVYLAQASVLLATQKHLVVTVPSKLALLMRENPRVAIKPPPFEIPPFELKMAWSPLLQRNPGHQWMRRLIGEVAREIDGDGPA